MWRVVASVVVAAGSLGCSDDKQPLGDAAVQPADGPPDADICARPAPGPIAACMSGGLAGVDLNGTWTLTGEQVLTQPSESTTPVNTQVTMLREGTGWCVFKLGYATTTLYFEPYWYVDDTLAYYWHKIEGRMTYERYICRRVSDGALVYHELAYGYAMNKPYSGTIDGTLSR